MPCHAIPPDPSLPPQFFQSQLIPTGQSSLSVETHTHHTLPYFQGKKEIKGKERENRCPESLQAFSEPISCFPQPKKQPSNPKTIIILITIVNIIPFPHPNAEKPIYLLGTVSLPISQRQPHQIKHQSIVVTTPAPISLPSSHYSPVTPASPSSKSSSPSSSTAKTPPPAPTAGCAINKGIKGGGGGSGW